MRITEKIEDIDYHETKEFFKNRAGKFREDNPYSVTMYQDNNAKLVKERNQKEIEKLKPMLYLAPDSKVLDVACGIGRWADAIQENIEEYCGVDFSRELIEIANKRIQKEQFSFYEGAATELEAVLDANGKGSYNAILMIGILIYINDKDITAFLEQVEKRCEAHTRICIREPIAVQKRLMLKDFFSEELQDNYNAIYRTRAELIELFGHTLFQKGFQIEKEGFLFEEDALNNRKETIQYYYILKR